MEVDSQMVFFKTEAVIDLEIEKTQSIKKTRPKKDKENEKNTLQIFQLKSFVTKCQKNT